MGYFASKYGNQSIAPNQSMLPKKATLAVPKKPSLLQSILTAIANAPKKNIKKTGEAVNKILKPIQQPIQQKGNDLRAIIDSLIKPKPVMKFQTGAGFENLKPTNEAILNLGKGPISKQTATGIIQQKAKEIIKKPDTLIPTRPEIKLPFIQKAVQVPAGPGSDTIGSIAKSLIEIPERATKSVIEARAILHGKSLPATGKKIYEVPSYNEKVKKRTENLIDQGFSPIEAALFAIGETGGEIAGDFLIITPYLKGALNAVSRGIKIPDSATNLAWQRLGKPRTLLEAQRNNKALQAKYHPDINPQGAVKSDEANTAYTLLEKIVISKQPPNTTRAIFEKASILKQPGKILSKIKETADTLLSPVSEFGKLKGTQPIVSKTGVRKLLPEQAGTMPTQPYTGLRPTPSFGLSTKEIKATPIQEAKGKSLEDFLKAQGTPVYHGGAGIDELNKGVKILSPEEKLKLPSSGGGFIGLSTTADKNYAKQFSKNIAGREDVAELFISPNAKIKEISGAIDDMSANEIIALSKKYDVLKSVEENEFRILNADILKTKSQIETIWKEANKSILPGGVKPPNILENIKKAGERQIEIDTLEQVLNEPPFDDLKKLAKYATESGKKLPEVGKELTGENAKTIFGRYGDEIAADLGFEDSEGLRRKFEEYVSLRTKLDDLKQTSIGKKELKNLTASLMNPKAGPLSRKVPELAKTIETQVKQVSSKIDPKYKKEVSSLPDIIKKSATNVKEKVNFIDMYRTPDRVLEKIGLGEEAKQLRRGYNSYEIELPKNIAKTTEWAKRVSKESNIKIFQYLDGKEIALNQTELKVAGEIKDWLKSWAERLGLPKDRRITNYITHLFDETLLKKEFDEDLAKIIADKIPGEIYDPFLLSRLGARGYRQDTWAALDAYVKRATRKANIDPALEAIKKKTGPSLEMTGLEESQFKFVQKHISGVNMRPTEIDNLIDNGVKSIFGYRFGQRPVTRVSKILRQMTYRGMLGLNLSSALRNFSQGINTYAILGNKYTALGYAKLFNKSNLQELTEQGVLSQGFIQDRALSSTKKLIERADKVLFSFFDTVEKINRGSAYLGAKAKAIASGKTEEQAIEYAKSIVKKTQFRFDPVDTPVGLQSDIMKTLFQFQNFTLKQTEFLGEMVKDKNFIGLFRYGIAGLFFVLTIGRAFGMKPEELIPYFRFGTPPSLKAPAAIGGAILNTPDKYGNKRDWQKKGSDIIKSLTGLIPAGTQAKKTYEGIKAFQQGKSTTKAGTAQFNVGGTFLKDLQAGFFGKYASKEARDYFSGTSYTEAMYKQLNKMTPEEAKPFTDDLYENNRPLYDRLSAMKKDEDLGITDKEKEIRKMGVENGQRAKIIFKEIQKLKTDEEKNAYINDLWNKKVITEKVYDQIKELADKNK